MTATKQFIEDAIAGGRKIENLRFNGGLLYPNSLSSRSDVGLADILIDPLAWQAVGKTRGWYVAEGWLNEGKSTHLRHWKAFIDWLDQGKTIEEALSLI